jgi:hypothetical protein
VREELPDFKDSHMSLAIAQLVVATFETYAAAGLGFTLIFLPRGLLRVDPRVAGAPATFRLVILPGIVAFWPLFAWRWIAGAREPIERNPHRSKARDVASQEVAR